MSEPKAASAGGKKKNQKKVTLSLQEFNKTVLPEHDPQSQWGDIDITEEDEYDHREQSSNTSSDSYQNRQNANRREYGYRDNQRDNYRDNYQRENRDRPQRDNRDRKHNEIPNNPPFVAYVGNLSYSVTKEDLEDFFRANCDVEDVRLIVDNNSPDKRSKGFGYITFRTKEDLETALTADNADLGGRPIRVDVSTPREGQSSSNPRGERGERGERDTFIRRENRFEQSRADSADTWERGKVVVAKPADLPPRREFKSDRPRRDNRPPRDDSTEERKEEEVRERQPLKLQPKSSGSDSSSESPSAKSKANPFGEAKPRDERAFEERRQKELAERVVQEPSSDSPKEEAPKANNNDSKYRPPRGNNSGKQFNFSNRGNNNNNSQRNPKKKGPRSEIQPDSDGFVPTSKAAPSQSVQSTPAPASGPSIKNKFSALSNE